MIPLLRSALKWGVGIVSRSDTRELVRLERRDDRPSSPIMLVVEAVRP